MSKQMEYAIKGGIIGGLIGLALHLLFKLIRAIFGFLFKYWYITLPLLAYLVVNNQIRYWWNDGATRDAIRSSFQKERVVLSGVVGRPASYAGATGVQYIEFTLTNNANARIYAVSANCTYHPKELADEDIKFARVRTEDKYAAHIAPGSSVRIKLRFEPDGYLNNADPNGFACEPIYSHENADLFQGEHKKLSLDSQMDANVTYILKPRSQYSDSTFVSVTGTLRNNSQQIVTEAKVVCEVTNLFGVTDYYSKRYRDLTLKPGQVMSLDAQVTMVRYKPTSTVCRLDRVSA